MDAPVFWRFSPVVTIDDQLITLPDWLTASLPAIQSYIECMVIKKERVLWALRVDGVAVDLGRREVPDFPFQSVQARTIGFDDLSRFLIVAGRAKVREVRYLVEKASVWVLINSPRAAQRFWADCAAQCREPLFGVRALQELNPSRVQECLSGRPLGQLVEELNLMEREVNGFFAAASEDSEANVLFSEMLEFTILPWLDHLEDCFARLENGRLPNFGTGA